MTNQPKQSRTTSNGLVSINETSDPLDPFLSTIDLHLNTNMIVNLFDCMKCYIRIPRCQTLESMNGSSACTPTDSVQQQHEEQDARSDTTEKIDLDDEELEEEEQDVWSGQTVELDLDQQLQELREEQENLFPPQSPHLNQPTNSLSSKENEGKEQFLDLDWDLDELGFMERYIIIDLPWPQEELE